MIGIQMWGPSLWNQMYLEPPPQARQCKFYTVMVAIHVLGCDVCIWSKLSWKWTQVFEGPLAHCPRGATISDLFLPNGLLHLVTVQSLLIWPRLFVKSSPSLELTLSSLIFFWGGGGPRYSCFQSEGTHIWISIIAGSVVGFHAMHGTDGWLANLGKDVASGELSHIATPIFVDSQWFSCFSKYKNFTIMLTLGNDSRALDSQSTSYMTNNNLGNAD